MCCACVCLLIVVECEYLFTASTGMMTDSACCANDYRRGITGNKARAGGDPKNGEEKGRIEFPNDLSICNPLMTLYFLYSMLSYE